MISFIKTAKDRPRVGFCIPEAIDYNTVMLRTGADISGACGQLRRGYLDEKKKTIDNAGSGSVTAGGAGSKEIDA